MADNFPDVSGVKFYLKRFSVLVGLVVVAEAASAFLLSARPLPHGHFFPHIFVVVLVLAPFFYLLSCRPLLGHIRDQRQLLGNLRTTEGLYGAANLALLALLAAEELDDGLRTVLPVLACAASASSICVIDAPSTSEAPRRICSWSASSDAQAAFPAELLAKWRDRALQDDPVTDTVDDGSAGCHVAVIPFGSGAKGGFMIFSRDSAGNRWGETEVEALETVANSVGAVVMRKRMEEELARSRASYRSIVESFDGLVYLCSRDYRIEFMNSAFIKRTGRDATGEFCYTALHDLSEKCPWCVNDAVFQGCTIRSEVLSPKDNRWYYVISTPVVNPGGSISKQAMIIDITERKATDQRLRENEERYRSLFENAFEGIFCFSASGELLEANSSLVRMLCAQSIDELRETPLSSCFAETSSFRALVRRLRREGECLDYETLLVGIDGTPIVGAIYAKVVRDDAGRDLRYEGMVLDLTARKDAERALAASEQRFRMLVESLDGIVWEADAGTFTYRFVSRQTKRILGYSVRQWLDDPQFWRCIIHPEDRDAVVADRLDAVRRLGRSEREYRLVSASGETVWVRESVVVAQAQGQPYALRGVLVDITHLKESGRRLAAMVREKETLLKEVHHRVKNNLMVVSSLLHLQNATAVASGGEIMSLLDDCQKRITAIALVHEKLYHSSSPGKIDFGHYVRSLVANLSDTVSSQMRITVGGSESIYLDLDTAIPCGLILNELVSNATKHAFLSRAGEVAVHLVREGPEILLSVTDDGSGFDAAPADPSDKLGMRLVVMLVEQIGATLTLDSAAGGTAFVLHLNAGDSGRGEALDA